MRGRCRDIVPSEDRSGKDAPLVIRTKGIVGMAFGATSTVSSRFVAKLGRKSPRTVNAAFNARARATSRGSWGTEEALV